MSKLRKKSTITVIILISLCAIIMFDQYARLSSAWDDQEELTAPIGPLPVIDGKKDSVWTSSNSTDNDSPNLRLHVMINASFLYVLVEVQVANHNDDEYVRLLLSNSTDLEVEDFVDAKLIQTRNFSNSETRSYYYEDQNYDNGDYVNDTETNFIGAANVTTAANSYSYYEFRLDSGAINDDYHNDTFIDFEKTYAITVQFGDHEEGEEPTVQETDTILLLFEQSIPPLPPVPVDYRILTYIVFSIVGAAFIGIAVFTYQSRSKL